MDSTGTSGFNDVDDFSEGDDESETVGTGCAAGFVCSLHSSVSEVKVNAVDTVESESKCKYRPTQFCLENHNHKKLHDLKVENTIPASSRFSLGTKKFSNLGIFFKTAASFSSFSARSFLYFAPLCLFLPSIVIS